MKSIAPRDCESPGDCATGEVCEEYDATGFCTSGTGSRCVADCRMSGEPCTDATCDEASGLCLALACPTAWTCATNHDCNAASPGADVHGCVRRACENATVCDCGECVGGACWDGPGHCGGLCDCAAPDTPVATPDGDRPLAELREGDLVYSVDAHGVVVVPLARASRRPVDPAHEVVRVELEDGRSFEMSPGHPTAEGTPLGEIRVGEVLGTSVVRAVTMVSYPHAYTHDILPASDSRAYFASGALVGSTLTR